MAVRPVNTSVARSITIDHGRVFVSEAFYLAAEELEASVQPAAVYTPSDKSHIERHLRTIGTMFVQYLTGYVSRNPAMRGKNPETEPLWAIEDLQNILDHWVVGDYQNTAHSGLTVPGLHRTSLTPNEAYAALAGVSPQPRLSLAPDDYRRFLPRKYVTVDRNGIRFNGLRYTADGLAAIMDRKSGLGGKAGDKWEMRYDPYRVREIYLWNHVDRVWVTARWGDDTTPQFSVEEARAAIAILRRRDEAAGDHGRNTYATTTIREALLDVQDAREQAAKHGRGRPSRVARTGSDPFADPDLHVVPVDDIGTEPDEQRPADDQDDDTLPLLS